MRTIAIISLLGALIGAAVFGLLDLTGHIQHGSSTFGWTSPMPRRYADYLPQSAHVTAWWAVLVVAVAAGVIVGAALGATAMLTGLRVRSGRG